MTQQDDDMFRFEPPPSEPRVGSGGFWLMVILLSSVVAVMLALAVEFGCQSYRRGREIAELRENGQALENELKTARERMSGLELQIDSMEQLINDQKLLIEGKQGEVALLEKQLSGLRKDYEEQSAEADQTKSLRAENDKLIKEVNRMYGDVGKLKTELSRMQQEEDERERALNNLGRNGNDRREREGRAPARPRAAEAGDRPAPAAREKLRCPYCQGTGTATLYVKCPGCGGLRRRTGSLSGCPDCNGTGKVYKTGPCPRCAAMGRR